MFRLILPFALSSDISSSAISLHRNLKDTSNCKFIFNDIVKNLAPIKGEDNRYGAEIEFAERKKMALLPATDIEIKDDVVSFNVPGTSFSESKTKNFYLRLLLRPRVNTLAYERAGIAKSTLIYDVKLNEKRNLPESVHEFLDSGFSLCKIDSCFCFHIVPNTFDISFVAQPHLKNIRGLEVSAFKKYLPEDLKTLQEGHYTIVFNKQEKQNSFSFFTVFSKERIGSEQIVFAIIANMLCSLLFGMYALRISRDPKRPLIEQLPYEYAFAIIILILGIAYLGWPWAKRIKRFSRS